jgi:peptidoglycan hydrolase FlgJ
MDVASVRSVTSARVMGAAGLGASSAGPAKSPLVQFEAFVLQEFVSAMLPEEAANVYGKGLSGEMWQSMFAEKIAAQMAERGGIGIAGRLIKDFHMDGDERHAIQGVSDPRMAVAKGESAALAKAMLHDLQTEKFGLSAVLNSETAEAGK